MQKKEKEYDKRVAVLFHMMALCYKKGYDCVQPFELPINKSFKNHVRTSF